MIENLRSKTESNWAENLTLREVFLASQLATVRDSIRKAETEILQTIELNHDMIAILRSLMEESLDSKSLTSLMKRSKTDLNDSESSLLYAKKVSDEWTGIQELASQITCLQNGKRYRVKTDEENSCVTLLNYALYRLKSADLLEEVMDEESSDDEFATPSGISNFFMRLENYFCNCKFFFCY